LLAGNVAALLLTAGLGWLTFRRIVHPIRALEASVKTIASGDYATEVPFVAKADETGGLARSIDVLKQGAAAMAEKRWVKTCTAQLTGAVQGAASLADFGRRFVSGLVPMLGGGVAVLYAWEEKSGRFQRVAAYALATEDGAAESFASGEGLAGAVRAGAQTGQPRAVAAGVSAHCLGLGRRRTATSCGASAALPGKCAGGCSNSPRSATFTPGRKPCWRNFCR